jgi:uncharacterized membrane protein YkoI
MAARPSRGTPHGKEYAMLQKRIPLILTAIPALLAGLLLVSCGENEMSDRDEKVSIDQVPAEVRAAIEKHADGATVKEIEREVEHGKTIYSVEATRGGQPIEFEVSADGKHIKDEKADDDGEDDDADENEQEIDVAALPAAVTKAVLAKHPGAKLTEAEICKEGDKTFYEVEVATGGASRELNVTPDGTITADQADDDDGEDDDDDDDAKPTLKQN